MPPFGRYVTPTRGMGKIAECFRAYPGTLRSEHPRVSFCANGKYAEQITKTHVLAPSFGMDTPLGALYRINAKILLLGVGYSNCTAFHLGETLSGVQPKTKVGASIYEKGKRVWKWFEDYDYSSHDYEQIGLEFESSPDVNVKNGVVGLAKCKMFNIKPAVDFSKEWITKFRQNEE